MPALCWQWQFGCLKWTRSIALVHSMGMTETLPKMCDTTKWRPKVRDVVQTNAELILWIFRPRVAKELICVNLLRTSGFHLIIRLANRMNISFSSPFTFAITSSKVRSLQIML
jgi:hypothetical protein